MTLISNNHTSEGIELLWAAGLGQTACMHLQHAGHWVQAARYPLCSYHLVYGLISPASCGVL